MRKFLLSSLFVLAGAGTLSAATFVLTVAGLGGEPDYEQRFQLLATDVDKLMKAGNSGDRVVETLKGADATKTRIEAVLNKFAADAKPADALIVMLIGHGTFDGTEYKFNLPGPDISGEQLLALVNKNQAGRQLIVDMTSASGAIKDLFKKDNRVVVTATRAGTEKNATVFARYWVEALRDNSADLDKNEVISAQECFQYAEKKTADFYKEQKRLATEHPQIDDAQRAASFPVLRYGSAAAVVTDPAKKALVAKKEDIENRIDALKYQKSLLAPADYQKQLTALLLELARTQAEIDK